MLDRADAQHALEELISKRHGQGFDQRNSEADIREQLVVPLLRDVLGWNTNDHREFSRERYSRGAGVADCVCLIENVPVLYVEAKRLGVIPSPAELRRTRLFYTQEEEQALRYARRSTDMRPGERWTVLTNFDRLRVFEATTEQEVFAFESPEALLEGLDKLLLLGRPGVLDGSLRRELALRGKPEVDEEFRQALNEWRLRLAQDIYDRNPGVELGEIQRAVQRLLDRLIILQFAADIDALGPSDPVREILARNPAMRDARALVEPHPLKGELLRVSRRFDAMYNTSLFAPGHPVEDLDVGDDALRLVMESIAGQSFRRLDADILGTTYETYLGHVLVVKDGHLSLDLRPEIRRQGGVYYTPRHVVEHIVRTTIAPLLEAVETPEEVDTIRVIDPSCGSGSFLIRAFDVFADWYEVENGKRKARLELGPAGQTALEELGPQPIHDFGRRILERNLYGVDIDPEAAEIATVNLIMQALRRGPGGLDLGRLPLLLGQNIKVGNSVIPGMPATSPRPLREAYDAGADVLTEIRDTRARLAAARDPNDEHHYAAQVAQLTRDVRSKLDELLPAAGIEPQRRSPFHWPVEFPEVFDPAAADIDRGFSVVVGNPPWQGFQGDAEDRPYLGRQYGTAVGRFDVYVPFIELALNLLREGGVLGYITPSNFLLRDYGLELRRLLKGTVTVRQLIDWGHVQVFAGATNYSLIVVLDKRPAAPDSAVSYMRETYDHDMARPHPQADLADEGWVFLTPAEAALFQHLEEASTARLGDVCRGAGGTSGLAEGIITGQNDVFLLEPDQAQRLRLEADFVRPCVKGEDVTRWLVTPPYRTLVYPYSAEGEVISEDRLRQATNTFGWLSRHRRIRSSDGGLAGRGYFDRSRKQWYELWNQRSPGLLDVSKLITPEVNDRPEFAVVEPEVAFTNSVTSATPAPGGGLCLEFLAAQLNSRVLALYHARHSVPKANGFLIYTPAFLKQLPVVVTDMSNRRQRALHDEIVDQVHHAAAIVQELADLDVDFAPRLRQFAIERRSVQGLLNRFGADAVEILIAEPGDVRRLTVTAGDMGSLHISAQVRLRARQYERGEFDEVPILRIRITEPYDSFLRYYLPVWQDVVRQEHRPRRRRRRGRGPISPTVATAVLSIPLPDISDEDIRAVVADHQPVVDRRSELKELLMTAEAEIEERLFDLFGLDDEMRESVRQYRPPAELFAEQRHQPRAAIDVA